MSDDVWSRPEIESPCVKVCVLDPVSGLCLGCHRDRDEIAGWSRMTTERRREIMETLGARAAGQRRQRRGGRAARVTNATKPSG